MRKIITGKVEAMKTKGTILIIIAFYMGCATGTSYKYIKMDEPLPAKKE